MAANKKSKSFLLAVFSLVGTTIGAGIFSLPYVFSKSGFIIGLAEFIILVCVVLLIQLIIGEIALRTKGKKRFIGYVDEYLNYKWKFFLSLSVIFGSVGTLLVYIILGGRFLSFITNSAAFSSSLIFFIFWFLFILIKPKTFGKAELIFGFSVILIIILILSLNIGYIKIGNFVGFHISNIFFPYGVILFAISGFYVIPEMEDILGTDKRYLKKAIIYGTLIPAFIYLFFVFIVLGVSGPSTSEDAVSGLAYAVNSKSIILLGSFLGLLAVFEASLSLGIYFKETLCYDFKFNKWLAWFFVGIAPLTLFIFGIRNLIAVISIIGSLFFAFQAIVILVIHKRFKTSEFKPLYQIRLSNVTYYVIGLMAILGAIIEILYSLSL